jgi:hypothetical protein
MTRRLVALAVALYPRRWKRRYGQELADLCEEYLAAGETTRLGLLAGLAGSGVVQRLREVVPSRRFAVLVTSALLLTTTGAVAVSTDGLGFMSAGGKALPTRVVVAAPAKPVAMLGRSCTCRGRLVTWGALPPGFPPPDVSRGNAVVLAQVLPAILPSLPSPNCPSSVAGRH